MRNKHIKSIYLGAIVAMAVCAPFSFAEVTNVTADGTAEIEFFGKSTLHDFEGTVKALPFKISVNKDIKSGKLYATAEVKVDILRMNTGNKARDKKMRKMFNIKKYTQITGKMTNALFPGEGKEADIPMELEMHGVKKSVVTKISDCKIDDKQATGIISFTISLKDFGIKPPSVIGIIRVGNDVKVECRITGRLDSASAKDI